MPACGQPTGSCSRGRAALMSQGRGPWGRRCSVARLRWVTVGEPRSKAWAIHGDLGGDRPMKPIHTPSLRIQGQGVASLLPRGQSEQEDEEILRDQAR